MYYISPEHPFLASFAVNQLRVLSSFIVTTALHPSSCLCLKFWHLVPLWFPLKYQGRFLKYKSACVFLLTQWLPVLHSRDYHLSKDTEYQFFIVACLFLLCCCWILQIFTYSPKVVRVYCSRDCIPASHSALESHCVCIYYTQLWDLEELFAPPIMF